MTATIQTTPGLRSGTVDGIPWKILASPLRTSLNGYVYVDPGHPWHGRDYDDIDAEAPGGVTFAADGWIGFDTAHLDDWWSDEELARVGIVEPNRYRRAPFDDDYHWTLEVVVAATEELARQAAAARPVTPADARARASDADTEQPNISAVWLEVLAARARAHAKHGDQSIEALPGGDPRWLSVLVEEIGEVAHEQTYDATGSLRAELIDVLSVASAWVDAIDRAEAERD